MVGWVEERNPTLSILCWVTLREAAVASTLRSTQPTPALVFMLNNNGIEIQNLKSKI